MKILIQDNLMDVQKTKNAIKVMNQKMYDYSYPNPLWHGHKILLKPHSCLELFKDKLPSQSIKSTEPSIH